MFSTVFSLRSIEKAGYLRKILLLSGIAFGLTITPSTAAAEQNQSGASQQPQNPNQQEAPPEAGGPNGEVGPYGIPKKGAEPPPPPPSRPKKIEGMPDYSIHVD